MATLVSAWDEGVREFKISLGEMPDSDLWRRPHERLLSVGEVAGHVALAEAIWLLGTGSWDIDLSSLPLQSPLIDPRFRYYPHQIAESVTLPLTSESLVSEYDRIHALAKSAALAHAGDDEYPGQWRTWGILVQYKVFHIAYHTGQIYSARHVLGHQTEDN